MKPDDELQREIDAHLDLEVEEGVQRGLSVDEARHAARRAFGSTARIKEEVHEMWAWMWLERLAQDLRYALRTMRRNPGFAMAAVLSLALAIGANTAIFTLYDAVLLKDLPVREADHLVQLEQIINGKALNFFSWPVVQELRAHASNLTDIVAWSLRPMNGDLNRGIEPITSMLVTGNYYLALGVPAAVGRTLLPEDDREGAPAVAMLGYGAWQKRFAGNAGILGRSLTIEGVPVTVVGIVPSWFLGTEVGRTPDLVVPVALQPQLMRDRPMLTRVDAQWLRVMARLEPGMTAKQASAQLEVLWPQLTAALDPDASHGIRGSGGLRLTRASTGLSPLRAQFSQPLFVLMAVVGLVLLMACTNVANLLLARATVRQREMAIRLAIGAGRLRLVRQLLTESVLLAAVSSALGAVFAFWGVDVLARLLSTGRTAVVLDLSPDARVLGFTVAVTLLTAVIFGLAPALRAAGVDFDAALKMSSRSQAGSRRAANQLLVVVQVALCLVLLAGAGLFVRTLQNLLTSDAGFARDGVLLVAINPARAGYRGPALANLYRQVLEQMKGLHGVGSASLSVYPPVNGNGGTFFSGVTIDGQIRDSRGNVYVNVISPRFFETLRIPIMAGHAFTGQEAPQTARTVVVSETFAREFLPNGAVGHRVQIGGSPEAEIVGVARDAKYETLKESPHRVIYLAYTQSLGAAGAVYLELRRTADLTALSADARQALRHVASQMPVDTFTMKEWLDQFLVQERLLALLSSAFGIVALILAAVGLYGVISYTATRRTAEIGLRIALGAPSSAIRWLIVRGTLGLTSVGIIGGLLATLIAGRFVSSLLFGLTPTDAPTLGFVGALLIAVAMLAGYLPARRASRVNPTIALRAE